MLSLVVWGSLVPPIPTLILALLIDSPQTLINSMSNLDMMSIFAVLYLAFGSTLFGYGFWSILISKYPINKISPLSLLVPITGLLTASIVLLEKLSKLQWLGVCVIIIGLMVTNLDVKQIINMINKNKTNASHTWLSQANSQYLHCFLYSSILKSKLNCILFIII